MESNVSVTLAEHSAEQRLDHNGTIRKTPMQFALQDLRDGFSHWWMWNAMAWQDILQRYRGSVLGPFWLTISMFIMIVALGILYSTLFKMEITSYLPFLCLGILSWNMISSMINESCHTFVVAEPIIKQIKIPFSVHVYRIVWRNLIIAAHNSVVYIFVMLYFGIKPDMATLLFLPGLLLTVLNAVWSGLLLGMICARFRDVPQIVGSLVQIAFFVTPIIWKAELLGKYQDVAHINPFFAFVDLLRAPLLGEMPHMLSWVGAIGVTIVGWAVVLAFFARFRARIPYWC